MTPSPPRLLFRAAAAAPSQIPVLQPVGVALQSAGCCRAERSASAMDTRPGTDATVSGVRHAMIRATQATRALAWIALFMLGACAGASRDDAPQFPEGAPVHVSPAGDPYPDLEGPPPVTVRFGEEAIE